ncbi:hypothetical protein EJB05_33765, partial [Eragrostis curvula]
MRMSRRPPPYEALAPSEPARPRPPPSSTPCPIGGGATAPIRAEAAQSGHHPTSVQGMPRSTASSHGYPQVTPRHRRRPRRHGRGKSLDAATAPVVSFLQNPQLMQSIDYGMSNIQGLMVATGSESPVVVVLSGSMEPGFKRYLLIGALGLLAITSKESRLRSSPATPTAAEGRVRAPRVREDEPEKSTSRHNSRSPCYEDSTGNATATSLQQSVPTLSPKVATDDEATPSAAPGAHPRRHRDLLIIQDTSAPRQLSHDAEAQWRSTTHVPYNEAAAPTHEADTTQESATTLPPETVCIVKSIDPGHRDTNVGGPLRRHSAQRQRHGHPPLMAFILSKPQR